EGGLSEAVGIGAPTPYLSRWYAPKSTSFIDAALGTSPATRRCDGSLVGASDPGYVLVDGDTRQNAALDWNGNGQIAGSAVQDVNFDGTPAETLTGADDFATMDLRQVGARRPVGSQQLSYSVVDPQTGIAPTPPAAAIGGGLSLDASEGDLGYG